jgi:DNA polymerase IIIc chi subunit
MEAVNTILDLTSESSDNSPSSPVVDHKSRVDHKSNTFQSFGGFTITPINANSPLCDFPAKPTIQMVDGILQNLESVKRDVERIKRYNGKASTIKSLSFYYINVLVDLINLTPIELKQKYKTDDIEFLVNSAEDAARLSGCTITTNTLKDAIIKSVSTQKQLREKIEKLEAENARLSLLVKPPMFPESSAPSPFIFGQSTAPPPFVFESLCKRRKRE